MDTREWFDEGKYSDLTVKLSDGAEIKVHKIIVCRANEYFRKLCGTESHFAESEQKTIELKEDDPTALRYVLRSIYKLPVVAGLTGKEEWRVWLDLHQTSDKYLEPGLSRAALKNFYEAALKSTNSDTIFDIIGAISSEMAHDEDLVEFGEKLRRDNIGIITKNDRFRTQLASGGIEAIWQQVDDLILAADVEKKRYYLCTIHIKHMFQEPSIGADGKTTDQCSVCKLSDRNGFGGHGHSASRLYQEQTAWLPK